MTYPDFQSDLAAFNERVTLFNEHADSLPADVRAREHTYLAAEQVRLERWQEALNGQQPTPAQPAAQPTEQMSTRAKIGLWGVALIVGGFFLSAMGASFGVVLAMVGILLLIWSWIAKAPRHRAGHGGSSGATANAAAVQVAAQRAEMERRDAAARAQAAAEQEAARLRQEALARAQRMTSGTETTADDWN